MNKALEDISKNKLYNYFSYTLDKNKHFLEGYHNTISLFDDTSTIGKIINEKFH